MLRVTKPGLLVDAAVEPRIGVRLVDDERLAGREDVAGDAGGVQDADLALMFPCATRE